MEVARAPVGLLVRAYAGPGCMSCLSFYFYTHIGRDPFIQKSDRSDREKWSTSKGGPVFSKLFRLDRTDPSSFGRKFPEILVEWVAPIDFTPRKDATTTFFAGKYIFVLRATKHSISHKMFELWILEFSYVYILY